jgi:hypothetical protein
MFFLFDLFIITIIIIIITIIISLVLMRFYMPALLLAKSLSPTPRALRLPRPDIFCSRLSHAAAKSPSLSHHLPGESRPFRCRRCRGRWKFEEGFPVSSFPIEPKFPKKEEKCTSIKLFKLFSSMALLFWKGRNE